jgi:excisionase family DNA binding protein
VTRRPTATDLANDLEKVRPRTVIEDGIVIPAAAAGELAAVLAVGMRELARRDCRPFGVDVYDVLAGCKWWGTADLYMAKPSDSGKVEDVQEVTQAQAARLVGITRSAIRGRLDRGTLPHRRDERGRVRIRRSNLEQTQ